MKKLKIYLSNLTYETVSVATDVFPLNIGYLTSYCIKKFGDKVDISLFTNINELNEKIQECPPDILGMSNYIWNYNLLYIVMITIFKKNENIFIRLLNRKTFYKKSFI